MDAGGRAGPAGLGRPEARGQGYGERGLRDLCRLLLEMTPIVTLFVRTDNAAGDPAVRVDRHARTSLSYRSILFP